MANDPERSGEYDPYAVAPRPQESEQRFRDIAEISSDWFWETDSQSRFIYLSDRVFGALGVRPEFHYGKTRRALAAPNEDAAQWRAHLQDIEARKSFKSFIFRRVGADGRRQWISTSGVPYFDAAGVFGGYRGVASNVTREIEARESARWNAERFRDIAKSSSDRFWETDERHRFSYISDSSNAAFNVPINSLIGKTRWDAAGENPAESDLWRRHLTVLNSHKAFRGFQFVRRDAAGAYRHVSVSGVPIFDETGAFKGYRGSAMDITERVAADQAAETANARLAAAVENLSEIFVLWDAEDRLVICNEQFRYMNRDALEWTVPGTLFSDHIRATLDRGLVPGAIGREDAYFEERVAHHKNPGAPIEQERQNGRYLLISEQKTADGGTVTVSVDITERREIERLKSEFVATVSHELRTPLTSIKGALGLVASGALGDVAEKAMNMVNVAYRNSERLIGLVNDILDMEKLESGEMSFAFESVDISRLVRDAVDANAGLAETHHVSFVLGEMDDNVLVRGDSDRLTQVVANFLSNAAKFSPDDRVVEISVVRADDAVRVSVTDSGSGVPDAFEFRIFERFSQADGSDSRPKGGTGLGLNISKSIIDAHNGTIGFENRPSGGVTFYFLMKAAP